MKERDSNTRIYFSSIVCNYSLQSLTCNADEHSVSNASKTKNYCICSWWDGMRWRHVKCSTQMSPTLASKLVCSLVWHHYPLGLHHSGFHETGFVFIIRPPASIITTADHNEGFSEEGLLFHGSVL